ncbi:unnamed protein product [Microthlaspi erraticum]|uniref:Uncharacterized protein n=1 Tax=Microthlaspi erraticum TaxID=1685480 RepID=A0A6D2IHW2_9BRAS|nr:unnamed protein product [Microthlaspi erraticum]
MEKDEGSSVAQERQKKTEGKRIFEAVDDGSIEGTENEQEEDELSVVEEQREYEAGESAHEEENEAEVSGEEEKSEGAHGDEPMEIRLLIMQ